VVVPKGHDEDHTLVESLAHFCHTTLILEIVCVSEDSFVGRTHLIREGVVGLGAAKLVTRVLKDLAILDELSLDLNKVTILGTIVSNELSNNSHRLVRIKLHALSKEVLDVGTEGVEIATILVAVRARGKSVVAITTRYLILTSSLGLNIARMGSVGGGNSVCFPDIHLGTASSILTHCSRGVPVDNVSFTIDELDVMRALSITVTSSKLGSCLVVGVLGHASISIHANKVKSSVDSAIKLGIVNCECEFLSFELEDLILRFVVQHVHSGSNVLCVLTLGHKVQPESGTSGRNTISVDHIIGVDSINSTVCGTSDGIGAERLVPRGTGVAVLVAIDTMCPSPVCIHCNGLLLSLATTICSASSQIHSRVVLLLLVTNLLSRDSANKARNCE